MIRNITKYLISPILIGLLASCSGSGKKQTLLTEQEKLFKQSLVNLEISISGYEQFQPWKRSALVKHIGYGTAVGPYEILTTAENIIDSTMIQARCFGMNEYLEAVVKVVDYDLNLCLLEIVEKENCPELNPILFEEVFEKGKEVAGYWMSSVGEVSSSRGHMDRVRMMSCATTFQKSLSIVISNVSRPASAGQIYCFGVVPIGIASKGSEVEAGLIPSETINRFLAESRKEQYAGFGTTGFETYNLIDPTVRRFLKMPAEMKHGVYVSKVFRNGTGSDVLKNGDVLLSVNSTMINSHGHFEQPDYGKLSYEYMINKTNIGDAVSFDIWREGEMVKIDALTSNINPEDMLVPFQEYGKQPEYLVIGGFVFQKLTKDYLKMWGDNWRGKAPPHLYQYYLEKSLSPGDNREEIVLLSFVLPAPINQGYKNLGRLVVKSVNGIELKKISQLKEILETGNPSPYHVVEFEMDNPTVVIPKEALMMVDMQIKQMYGIDKLHNIEG